MGLSAAPITALAVTKMQSSKQGFEWSTVCGNQDCHEPLKQFIDMSQPIRVGNQCPKCLWVLDTSTLAEKIRAFNGQDKWGRLIR